MSYVRRQRLRYTLECIHQFGATVSIEEETSPKLVYSYANKEGLTPKIHALLLTLAGRKVPERWLIRNDF